MARRLRSQCGTDSAFHTAKVWLTIHIAHYGTRDRRLSSAGLQYGKQCHPVVLGGLLYSVGALFYLIGRPALWPGVFGTHDLFHLFVIAGSLAHYWFILKVVVPFGHCPQRVSIFSFVSLKSETVVRQ